MIITLCGSARFEPWFHMWNKALGLSGHCVFGLTSYPSMNGGNKDWYTAEDKEMLDSVHFNKIEASAAILVLNAFAYIGASTMTEIEFARNLGKRVYFIESWGQGIGVRRTHYPDYQDAARWFGAYGVKSPLNTYPSHDVGDITSTRVLGPASTRRSKIVRYLQDERDAILRTAAEKWRAGDDLVKMGVLVPKNKAKKRAA